MGKDLSTIVRDLPVEFDLEAARLGDYDRETVDPALPRVRVPHAHRAPAGDDRRDGRRRGEALRGVATDGSVPAARVAGSARPAGWGPARPARPPSEGGGLQLSLDFDAVVGPAEPDGDGRRVPTARPAARAGRRAGDLPTALAAAIADPSRIEVHAGDRIAALEPWLAAQPAVGVGLLLDDPRPRRGSPARAGPRRDGRPDRRRRGPGGRGDAAPAARSARGPGRRSRGQAAARRRASPTTRTRSPTPVAFDTQIAAYILNASLRSQTIADVVAEQLDLILPPVAELDSAGTGRARGAVGASPSASPLERRLARRGARPPVRRDRAAADRGPGPDGGDRRRARPRGARASWRRSSRPRSRGSRRRSTPTSGTSSISAAPSSSSRSSSSSSTCRRASGRRPATRPTRRCSRTCGPRTR